LVKNNKTIDFTDISVNDLCIFLSKMANNVQKGLTVIQKNEKDIRNMIQLIQVVREIRQLSMNENKRQYRADENQPILFIDD